MRELTADMFVSLDGFAAGGDGGQSWTFGYFGPEFAVLRLAGSHAWRLPAPRTRLHRRIGLREEHQPPAEAWPIRS